MEDTAVYIQAIESYEEKQDELSEELDRFITYIARTGDILGPWEKVQKVFMKKLTIVLDEFYTMAPYKVGKINANATNDDFDEMKKRLLQLTEEFDSPPFTIQRLCELLSEPRKNYTKCDKFMRGLEKNLMVVSSWSNLPRTLSDSNDNNMVNGVDSIPGNGYMPGSDRFKPHWSNLPPSPISTTPPKIPGAPDFTAVTSLTKPGDASSSEQAPKDEAEKAAPDETASSEDKTQTDEPTSIVATDENETSQKSNVSATIISSSPPKTVNIKRKIEDSNDEPTTETDKTAIDTQVPESPTKKLKSDTENERTDELNEKKEIGENVEEKGKNYDSAKTISDDSAKMDMDDASKIEQSVAVDDATKLESAEMKEHDSAKTNEPVLPDTNVDQNNPPQNVTSDLEKTDPEKTDKDDDGTSVDPPTKKLKSDDGEGESTQMEVD